MQIHKQYVLDEERRPIAVQVPIEEFRRIEEVLENYGLARLMDETRDDERLSREAAKDYYQSLKSTRKPRESCVDARRIARTSIVSFHSRAS